MNVLIEKAVPADAEAILAYLKRVGGETDNLTFGREGLPFTVKAETEYLSDMENSCDNVAAIHLYEKFGFKKIGTHPAFFKMEGEYVPFDYMVLELK
ncbi:MAG: hypothetical protein IJD81_05245 [Oscillospiraceae bacterium]|nr:hypothetical protein [Oscillospiraceae bacterium]